jgi:hypothetical protein
VCQVSILGLEFANWSSHINLVQFAVVLHLLQQGCPMQEFEAIKPQSKFLVVPKNNKKEH